MQCCVNEDVEGVRLLLQHGAKVNIQDNDLWTPLHVAAACGTIEIVKLLLEVKTKNTKILVFASCFERSRYIAK